MYVSTVDGKGVARNALKRTEPNQAQQAMHTDCTGWPMPGLVGAKGTVKHPRISYGYTFTFGDGRIYIRSYESIIGIGR